MLQGSKVLVLGGSGQLGTALLRELTAVGAILDAPGREEFDLFGEDLAARTVARSPHVVINATAYNDVGSAESEPGTSDAFRLNRDAPGALARACAELGIPFVHVSTDYVFDGSKREPLSEDDPPAPMQQYGRSKLAGEQAVLAAHPGATVVRTSTVYGRGSRQGPNYVDAIIAQARTKDVVEVVRPPVSSPTLSWDLAVGLLDLLQAGARGVVHFANRGACSRYELAAEAIRLAGLDDKVELRERPPFTGGPARPDYSVLGTARFAALTGKPPRTWQEALAAYLA